MAPFAIGIVFFSTKVSTCSRPRVSNLSEVLSLYGLVYKTKLFFSYPSHFSNIYKVFEYKIFMNPSVWSSTGVYSFNAFADHVPTMEDSGLSFSTGKTITSLKPICFNFEET